MNLLPKSKKTKKIESLTQQNKELEKENADLLYEMRIMVATSGLEYRRIKAKYKKIFSI